MSAGVRVNSSVAASLSVEDMVQTSVLFSTSVGIQPARVGSLCFTESKARDSEKLTHLVLTSNAFPGKPSSQLLPRSREDLLGDVCSRS